MQFIDSKSLLYSDTLVPDIFISDYLPELRSDYVKIYIYCLFLSGKSSTPATSDLARILGFSEDTVKKGLRDLNERGLLLWNGGDIVIRDIKEKKILEMYRLKSTSTPEEANAHSNRDNGRRQAIHSIQTTFFSGVMSPIWLTDIDMWFERYGFEPEVMLMLFQHCCDNNGLSRAYIAQVALDWHRRKIRNVFDVERYMREYKAMKTVSGKIRKKLKLHKPLDVYHEETVDKWVNQYQFPFEIIELALRRSLSAPNAGFTYYDKILTDWYSRGLDTPDKIFADQNKFRSQFDKDKNDRETMPDGFQKGSPSKFSGGSDVSYRQKRFDQRDYDGNYFDRFVSKDFGWDDAQQSLDIDGSDTQSADEIDTEEETVGIPETPDVNRESSE